MVAEANLKIDETTVSRLMDCIIKSKNLTKCAKASNMHPKTIKGIIANRLVKKSQLDKLVSFCNLVESEL